MCNLPSQPRGDAGEDYALISSVVFPLFLVLGQVLCIQAAGAEAGCSLNVEPGVRQLFLDDAGIAEMEGLVRVVHPPARHPRNPVLVPDTPWESRCQVYGTAYYDEAAGLFKLWYLTTPRDRGSKPLIVGEHERAPHTTLAAYAQSEDGLAWAKPELGIFPYDGDTANNLLGIGEYNCEGISVLHEPGDPDPARRWKAVYWDHGSGGWEMRENGPYAEDGPEDGFYVAFSPDGLHWTPYEGNPVIKAYCDTNQNVLYDARLEKYVAFSRFGFGRKLARSESPDFIHWTPPEVVLECDERDGPQTQIYGAGVDLYEGVYLAMIWIYREGGDKRIDTQLATSRDGIHWTRVGERATWLALGGMDSWEAGMARSTERIIRRGDRLYVYYCGVPVPHVRGLASKHRISSIGLLTLRRDGFVSLRPEGKKGVLLTRPFILPDGDLHLNADARGGAVTVALCSADATPVGGLERSSPIFGDVLNGVVHWGRPIPGGLRGKSVRLRFYIKRTDLYAYWWE